MAQKSWITEVANEMQGTESTDRALLDITRRIRPNLYHENIGILTSATTKRLEGGIDINSVGSVAFNRFKNLQWRDWKPIIQGEKDSIVPHVGNVDTVQFPLDQIWYNS